MSAEPVAKFEVQSLFGDVPVAKFVEEHLHRLPFALVGSAGCVREWGSWKAFGQMLADAGDDVSAVRTGEWYRGDTPRDGRTAQALIDDNYTIFIRHAERHQPGLAELAEAFERTFEGPVNIHVFATPAGAAGLSWHYDAEDVFILQTAGEKEYSLRKNTVNPWPLEETLPADMQYEREQMPLMRVRLRAGDLLYIPCGYWHKADAEDCGETAISLAVGVMSRTAMDVYEFVRKRLVETLVWRQRLPIAGSAACLSAEELEAHYRCVFQQLAGDLARTLDDPQLFADFFEQLPHAAAEREADQSEEK